MYRPPLPALQALIVEDLHDAADSMAEVLLLHGHGVRVAYSSIDAIRLAAEEMPDVILLDIGLPEINGWEVARWIRRSAQERQPIIIAVTGYCMDQDRLASADAGVDLHLAKPTDPAALADRLEMVRRYLAVREPESQAAGGRQVQNAGYESTTS